MEQRTEWTDKRLDDRINALERDMEALRDTPAVLSKLTEAVGNNTDASKILSTRIDKLTGGAAGMLVLIVLSLLGALIGVTVK